MAIYNSIVINCEGDFVDRGGRTHHFSVKGRHAHLLEPSCLSLPLSRWLCYLSDDKKSVERKLEPAGLQTMHCEKADMDIRARHLCLDHYEEV
jgi:hypothetical protein